MSSYIGTESCGTIGADHALYLGDLTYLPVTSPTAGSTVLWSAKGGDLTSSRTTPNQMNAFWDLTGAVVSAPFTTFIGRTYFSSSAVSLSPTPPLAISNRLFGPYNTISVWTQVQPTFFIGSNATFLAPVGRMSLNNPTYTFQAPVTVTTWAPFFSPTPPTTNCTVTNYQPFFAQVGTGTAINAPYSSPEQTGATLNAIVFFQTNAASCGAGMMAGTSGDTCQYRGRAGAWTGPSGTDYYTDGFMCAGTGCTSSAPTSSSVGVYDSGIRVVSAVSCTGCNSASISSGTLNLNVPTGTVTSVTGTANQITVTGTTTPAISLPSTVNFPGDTNAFTGTQYAAAMRTPEMRKVQTISYGSTPTLVGYDSGACSGSTPTITLSGTGEALAVTVATGSSGCTTGVIAQIDLGLTWIEGICVGSCAQGTGCANSADETADISYVITFADAPNLLLYVSDTALKPSTTYKWSVMCTGYDDAVLLDEKLKKPQQRSPLGWWDALKKWLYNPLA